MYKDELPFTLTTLEKEFVLALELCILCKTIIKSNLPISLSLSLSLYLSLLFSLKGKMKELIQEIDMRNIFHSKNIDFELDGI